MTTEDAEVRRERGELFFVHSSGCLSVPPVFRLPSFLPNPLGTIHVSARQAERLRVLRVFFTVCRSLPRQGSSGGAPVSYLSENNTRLLLGLDVFVLQ
jgi:hypothetical protein